MVENELQYTIHEWRDDPRLMTGRRWRPGDQKRVSTFPISTMLYTVLYTWRHELVANVGSAYNRVPLHDGEVRVPSHSIRVGPENISRLTECVVAIQARSVTFSVDEDHYRIPGKYQVYSRQPVRAFFSRRNFIEVPKGAYSNLRLIFLWGTRLIGFHTFDLPYRRILGVQLK